MLPNAASRAFEQLVGAAKEGLLALSAGVGLGVLAELMEEVDVVVDATSRDNAQRTAARHGHESGEVTLGARRSWQSRRTHRLSRWARRSS